MKLITLSPWIITCFAILGFSGCGGPDASITIDGSSTVFPVDAAWAEDFGRACYRRI